MYPLQNRPDVGETAAAGSLVPRFQFGLKWRRRRRLRFLKISSQKCEFKILGFESSPKVHSRLKHPGAGAGHNPEVLARAAPPNEPAA